MKRELIPRRSWAQWFFEDAADRRDRPEAHRHIHERANYPYAEMAALLRANQALDASYHELAKGAK